MVVRLDKLAEHGPSEAVQEPSPPGGPRVRARDSELPARGRLVVPGNALEHALVAAATEASARPLFYRLLLESPLLVLDASQAPGSGEGVRVLEKGEQVRAVGVELEGRLHTAIFSSLAVLQDSVQAEHRYISMLGRDLLNLMRGSHLILNPGARYGKQILPEEIEAILSGAATRGYATNVIKKDTKILLGQPSKVPTHLTDALSAAFRSRRDVRAAYLALCSWPESGEKHLMVGIDASGDWDTLMRAASAAVAAAARPEEMVDFVKMDDSSVASYMRSTQPFYKKKLLGIF